MITTASIGTPSNYIGSNKKWTKWLEILKRKRPPQNIIMIDKKELGGVGKYFPKFEEKK